MKGRFKVWRRIRRRSDRGDGIVLSDTNPSSTAVGGTSEDPTVARTICQENCLRFGQSIGAGSAWQDMLALGQSEYGLACDKAYSLLELLSGIACPAVFEQFRELLVSLRHPPEDASPSCWTGHAMAIYEEGVLNNIHGLIRRRIGSFFVASRFSRLVEDLKRTSRAERDRKRNADKRMKRLVPKNGPVEPPSGPTSGDATAAGQRVRTKATKMLLEEWREKEGGLQRTLEACEKSLMQAIRCGERYADWEQDVGEGILYFIPLLDIPSPFDPKGSIRSKRYVSTCQPPLHRNSPD